RRVSSNGRYLVASDGKPFFWLADTAWELIQRLTRSEAETYLKNVAEQGFNVVQVSALSHFWDLRVPNANGDQPLAGADPDKPLTTTGNNPANAEQYDYWDHADYVIDTAASLGVYVALLPTWGKYIIDNSAAPDYQPYQGIFDYDNAYSYGKWIGNRYADRSNVIWVLGGDRAPNTEPQRELVRRMARGIKDGGAKQLIAFHPIGGKSSSEWFQDEDWLDFNMYQSGHLSVDYPNYKVIASDYLKKPVKPIIDAEPRYEDSGINFSSANGRFSSYDVRQAAYWSVFAGSFGHTYGNGAIWQLHDSGHRADEIQSWHDALDAAGRSQMKFLRKLMEARPFLERVPDQSLVTNTDAGGSHIQATRGTNYAMVYSARGAAFSVNMGKITGDTVTTRWYNPRTGVSTLNGDYANTGTQVFQPPSSGVGNDWILLLDDTNADFSNP
ncbi:MAG: glycoside hydrolase family 140 protein, partial [Cohnella sp.]|nr:glycoside hydrolase family 140 protein [Cohnella sp.]